MRRLAITALPFLIAVTFSLAGGQGKPLPERGNLPRLLILDSAPKPDDKLFVNKPSAISDKDLLSEVVDKRKLKSHEFNDFTLYYSEKVLGIEDASRQTQLLEECAALLKSGSRTLHVSDLSADAQATIRGMFLSLPGPPATLQAATQPDLVLSTGLESTFDAHYKGHQASYTLRPGVRFSEWNGLMNRPSEVKSSDVDQAKKIDSALPEDSPLWAFVCTQRIGASDRLHFIDEAQKYLAQECQAAKVKFDAASRKAQAAVMGDYADRYGRLNKRDGAPQFSDLAPDDQRQAINWMQMTHASGEIDAKEFIYGCVTDSYQTNFTLSLLVPVAGGAANNSTIAVRCPVKP